ncbi:MAG: efflux RND transporter periplasmic adaptor subunit [Nitrospiraceae bacterium]
MENSRPTGLYLLGLGSILLVCLMAVALLSCGKREAGSAPAPPEVLVAEVVQKDVPIYREWVGTTAGYVDAQIRARVQGYLLSRQYTEGSFVKAGALLFQIDPRPYQAALDQAMGELQRAQAAYKKTQLDVARDTPLAAEGAISQKELDDAVQANAASQASVVAARAIVEKAKLNLDWTRVTSLIDGVAGISTAQIGDLISESTVMTTVSQVDPLKVLFPISEREYMVFAELIQRIQKARADQEADRSRQGRLELILADESLYPHRGKVALANRQIDVKTGTITMVSYFPNPGNLLRPGQFAKVRAPIETRRGALLVPQRAVEELQGKYRVAVVGADNKVAIRTVKPGERIGSLWLINEGLKPGETVVVEGLLKVRDGVVVSPKPAPSEPVPTGSEGPPQPAGSLH